MSDALSVVVEGSPIKCWIPAEDIETGALNQAKNLSNLPFVHKWIALMPDTHQGYGMPIGGVMATKGVVVPNAVGVDIGCGMCAVKLALTELSVDNIKTIMGLIRKAIPVGMSHHNEEQDDSLMPRRKDSIMLGPDFKDSIIEREYKKALHSLGTLGGGNHFIEIQRDEAGFIRVMIHSGSRNLGKQVADHYNDIAKELNKKWHSLVPAEHDLAFLPIDSEEGKMYVREMNYCVDFAFANRSLMITRILECFVKVLGPIEHEPIINIAHNYARMENHYGQNVVVHRKGATSARLGEVGIIPGSQGTCSYIVEGLGNPESFQSCSHGAGRKMGRNDAQKRLVLEDEIKKMDDLGVIHGIRSVADLDEAAGAYKDIDVVMENQKTLVKIVTKLIPLAVIKG